MVTMATHTKGLVCLQLIALISVISATPISNSSSGARNFKRSSVIHAYGIGEPTSITKEALTPRFDRDDYYKLRKRLLRREESQMYGSSVTLNDREILANEIIMFAKRKEFDAGFANPSIFSPSRRFFDVIDNIRKSELFQMIQRMPKGGALHVHDTALCSTDFLMNLTYWENLYICQNRAEDTILFRFSSSKPDSNNPNCEWELVAAERLKRGKNIVDDEIRRHLTLDPKENLTDINAAWKAFMDIFFTVDGLLFYAPAWKAYYYNALKEFREDGVQYMEFRTTLPILYDLNGTDFTPIDTALIYKQTLDEFMADFPDFIGSKLIYAPPRGVDNEICAEYVQIAIELKERLPGFFGGFDLVGQEDAGRPIIDFIDQLRKIPKDIDFYFHGGESNWFGSTTDENLIDIVLLGTKRIGHGYALVKHPAVLDIIKERDIAIEVNPISNQVLKLLGDERNHPCAFLFANNFPVVISSDDPSFWGATPLSHDFYVGFLGIASAHSDLRLLKQLAINSIAYSAMDSGRKEVAFYMWQKKWDEYIEWVIKGHQVNTNHILGA